MLDYYLILARLLFKKVLQIKSNIFVKVILRAFQMLTPAVRRRMLHEHRDLCSLDA